MRSYYELFEKIWKCQTPICEEFRPVHLIRDGNWIATGTLIVAHQEILTCEHIFPPGQQGTILYYRELQPVSLDIYPIRSFIPDPNKRDIALCRMGNPEIIDYVSCTGHHTWRENNSTISRYQNITEATSLVTGEKVRVIGRVGKESDCVDIIEYEALPCESGTPFLAVDGALLILTDAIAVTSDVRKYFRIKPEIELIGKAFRLGIA